MTDVRETVPAALAGERVDRVVALVTGLTRSTVSALIDDGAVRVSGRKIASRSHRLSEGDLLEVDVPLAADAVVCAPDPSVDVPLIEVGEHVIVIDKPADLVVHPGAGHAAGTLIQGLLARFPEIATVGEPERPGVVHRLDKGTSGLLVVARTSLAYESLTAQLAARRVERRYLTLVRGHFDVPAGLIDAPIGRADRDRTRMAVSSRGREARTRYEVRRSFDVPDPLDLVACRLETGRTHQIRVHLAAVGHPVAGDSRYRGARLPGLHRPFLHAYALVYEDPATGERRSFESPLPADLQAVLDSLERD